MTEINEHNRLFAEKEAKENKELESMVGDLADNEKSSDGDDDIFDKEMKMSVQDDHKSLKESMLETYKETMHDLEAEDMVPKKEEKKPLTYA